MTRGEAPQIYVKMIDQGPELNAGFLENFLDYTDEVAIEPVMNWNDPDQGDLAGKPKEELLSGAYFSKRKEACPSPFYISVIHSDLQVSVCCVDWSKETDVGNLREESLAEIWRGRRVRAFQMLHLETRAAEIPVVKRLQEAH